MNRISGRGRLWGMPGGAWFPAFAGKTRVTLLAMTRRLITLTPVSSTGQALALSHEGEGMSFDRLRTNGVGRDEQDFGPWQASGNARRCVVSRIRGKDR